VEGGVCADAIPTVTQAATARMKIVSDFMSKSRILHAIVLMRAESNKHPFQFH
jgi:hypothetical protein